MVVKNNATPKLRYTQHHGNTPASTPTNTITTMTHHQQNQNQNTSTSFVTRNLHLCSSFGSNNNNNNQSQNQNQNQNQQQAFNFEPNNNNNNNPSFGFLPPSLLSNQNNNNNDQNINDEEKEEQQQQESNTPTQNIEQEQEEGANDNSNSSSRTRQKFTSFYYNFELPPPHPSTLVTSPCSSSSSQQQQNNNENVLNQVLDEALDSSLVCDGEKISNFSDVFVPWPTEEKSLIGKGSFGRVLRVVPRVLFDQVQQEIATTSTLNSSSSFSFFCRHSSELSSSEVIFRIEQMQKQHQEESYQQPIVVVKELTKNNICKTPLAVNHFFGEVAATTPSSSTPKSLNKRIQVPFFSSHNNNENDSFSSPTPGSSSTNNNKNSIFHTPSSIYLVLQLCSAPRPSLETRIAHVISRNCPEKISKIDQLLNQITDKYLLTVLERIHTNNNNNSAMNHLNNNINNCNSLPSSQEDDDTFTHSLSSLRALFLNQLSDDQQDFLISNYFDEYDLMSTFVAARENLNLPPSSYSAYAKSFETPTVSPCLFDLIVAHKKIPTFTMANLILAQLAEGLKYLHENMRCVHRDLKTENIVVSTERRAILLRHENDSNSQDGTVYGVQFEEKIQATIVDFGFTKALDVDTPIFNRYLNESANNNNNFGSSTSNNNDSYFDNEIVGLVNPQDFIVAVEEAVTSSSKSESQECHHQYAVFNNTNQDGAVNNSNNNNNNTKTTMMPYSLTPCGTDIYNSFEFLLGVVSSYDKILSQCGSISAKRRPRWSHLSMIFDGNSSPSSEFENNERNLLTKMDGWGLGGIAFCCFHGRPAFRMNCPGGQQAMKNMSDHVRLRILKGIVEHGPKYDDFGSSHLTNHVVGMCSNLMKKELCDRWSAGQTWNYLVDALKNSSSSFGDDESTTTQNMILVSEYRAPTSYQAHENSFVHRVVDCSESNFFATSFENNYDYDDWNEEEEECEENDDDCLIREEYCDHQEEENGRRSVATSSTNSSLRRSGGQNNNNSEEEQQEEDEIDDIYLF